MSWAKSMLEALLTYGIILFCVAGLFLAIHLIDKSNE